MIRDVTGLNEARDGSAPSKDALVGLQKLAAANSNTATRHILESSLYLTLKTAESVAVRISDVLEYSPTRDSFISALGIYNVEVLKDMNDIHLHDFGIFLQLAPDVEEKQMLENNIQMSLQSGQIFLEDAIDVREIKNVKHANQLLKVRRKKKQNLDQQMKQKDVEMQTQSNIQMGQSAAESEIHKQQGIAESKVQLAQAQVEFDIKKLFTERDIKKELMQYEFELNKQLKEMELQVIDKKEQFKEDRKDDRTKLQANQQSAMIDQRKNDTGPIDFKDDDDFLSAIGSNPKEFESAGNDVMGGIPTSQFSPS
jgi:hypothetical protein